MVSGAMVGVLKELLADRVVLTDGTAIRFAGALSAPRIAPGSRVTILYTRDDDGEGMLVQSVKHM
ncbi:MAG TPA: hypothetical protein VNC82_17360 [Candidatus Limnocylindria bacterium]|nr:hypothetical protein [Candidatus Limnocylindria bacterium]